MFLGRTIMQPLLLIFVFAYVFPKIGQGIGGAQQSADEFSTLLVGGVIASAMIFQGVQAVALPLVQDFGYTREIEDRVLAPMPVWAVAMEKIVSGAIQALIAAAGRVPARAARRRARRCTCTCTGSYLDHAAAARRVHARRSLGLTIGTRVEPRQVPLIFSLLVIPMTYPRRGLLPVEARSRRCRG